LLSSQPQLKNNFRNNLKNYWQSRKSLLALISENQSVWWVAAFLVSVPVFFQAPMVRFFPWLSLIMTVGWLAFADRLLEHPKRQTWGSLTWGFSLTWLCGSIYWGWLRDLPLWHLPIEALALPWAIWAILKQPQYRVGGWFYLGSLLGTSITDLYFWLTGLIPHWQAIVRVETDILAVQAILQTAIGQIQTGWGIGSALVLATVLLVLGVRAIRSAETHHWAFSGAVLSTLLVDGLFGLVCALS